MAQEYHFSSRQKEYLELMLQPKNQEMWEVVMNESNQSINCINNQRCDYCRQFSLECRE